MWKGEEKNSNMEEMKIHNGVRREVREGERVVGREGRCGDIGSGR